MLVSADTVIELAPDARYGVDVVPASSRSIRSAVPTLTVRSVESTVTVVLAGTETTHVHRLVEIVAVCATVLELAMISVGYAK